MHTPNYKHFLCVLVTAFLVTGCGLFGDKPGKAGNKSKSVSGIPSGMFSLNEDPKKTAKTIKRIKEYRKKIEETLPFKDVLWEVTTSGEKIRNVTFWADSIYAETVNRKLFSYSTDIGHPQWVLKLESSIDYPLCPIKDLPDMQIKLKNRLNQFRKQLAELNVDRNAEEIQIKNLRDQIRATEEIILGLRGSDVFYFLSKGIIYCADRKTGKEMWRRRLDFMPSNAPAATLSAVYINSLEFNRLYVFDVVKKFEIDWIKVNAPITSKPVFEEPAIYFANDKGIVYAYNTETARELWQYKTERPIKSDLLIDGDIIYVGSTDYALYAIDRHAGVLKWKYETGFPITNQVAIGTRKLAKGNDVLVEKTAFFRTDNKREFYSLLINPPQSKHPYSLRWKFPDGKKFLTYGYGGAYVLGLDNDTLYALDIENGSVLNKYSLRDFPFRAVDPDQMTLYLGTADGYIFAVREPPPQW
jgi:outer membrane protein assembly factor BamB